MRRSERLHAGSTPASATFGTRRTEAIRLDEDPVLKTGGGEQPLVSSSLTASAEDNFLAGYANWFSGEVESLVPVGSTPTSVTDNLIPWSNGEDAWVTTRKVMVRFHPGSLQCENTLVCRCCGRTPPW